MPLQNGHAFPVGTNVDALFAWKPSVLLQAHVQYAGLIFKMLSKSIILDTLEKTLFQLLCSLLWIFILTETRPLSLLSQPLLLQLLPGLHLYQSRVCKFYRVLVKAVPLSSSV